MARITIVRNQTVWAVTALAIAALLLLLAGSANLAGGKDGLRTAVQRPQGYPQLVSVEPLPDDGEMCQWVPASAGATLAEALVQQKDAAKPAAGGKPTNADRAPLRTIRDPNPAFSAIAVEPQSNMLVVTDENLFRVLEFDRRDSTPPAARMTEPKRVIGGTRTKVEMICGVYIDPKTLETYILNNDTQNWVAIFSKNAQGNAAPDRYLVPPGGHTFGIAVDEVRQEMYFSIQAQNDVAVYRKSATGQEPPLREINGDDTHLEDPHGIAVDTKLNLLFVANHGSVARRGPQKAPGRPGEELLGTGKFDPPSITVYPRDAKGNARPLRIIEGPKTRLNWPAQIAVDEDAGELYVANDMDHSVIVFGVTDQGDTAPRRTIRGSKTGILNPTGIALDRKNKEIWVANMGNHSATAFPMSAHGDVAPVRTIRGGPADELALMIGNPGGVGYDTKREQILVPN
jgi:DNA-binding beta-propeller fold protein YncE